MDKYSEIKTVITREQIWKGNAKYKNYNAIVHSRCIYNINKHVCKLIESTEWHILNDSRCFKKIEINDELFKAKDINPIINEDQFIMIIFIFDKPEIYISIDINLIISMIENRYIEELKSLQNIKKQLDEYNLKFNCQVKKMNELGFPF